MLTIKILFIALAFIGCTDIIYPYLSSYLETKNILIDAGIPEDKKGSPQYRYRSILVLKNHCSNGLYEESFYNFHCNVDSPVPYWTSQLSRIANKYTVNDDNIY